MEYRHYDALAALFVYPDDDFPDHLERIQEVLKEAYPDAAAYLTPFVQGARRMLQQEAEELYTRSFEVQALTTLDVGYVLFGDDYKRGSLLVNLNREHREAGNDCDGELADHLPNVLRLLPKLGDLEVRADLVKHIVVPALAKIVGEFEPDVIRRKEKVYEKHHKTMIERSEEYGTLYRYPLTAVLLVLTKDFQVAADDLPDASRAFLKNITEEMELA